MGMQCARHRALKVVITSGLIHRHDSLPEIGPPIVAVGGALSINALQHVFDNSVT
jgi:hypothetical protein